MNIPRRSEGSEQTSGAAPGAADIAKAVATTDRLPSLPAVLVKVMETASDPDASALDLSRFITADQSLAAAILKLVNSPYYGFYRRITSITDAIVILGFIEVRNIVLTATALHNLGRGGSVYDRTLLWRHSMTAAIAAERAAKMLRLEAAGSFFAAGLLHDIGKVALDILFPEAFAQAVDMSVKHALPLEEVENSLYGLDHGAVGALLAEQWNLPDTISHAIRFHHYPRRSPSDTTVVGLAALGNVIAHEAGVSDNTTGCKAILPADTASELGLTEIDITTLATEVGEVRSRVDELMGVLES